MQDKLHKKVSDQYFSVYPKKVHRNWMEKLWSVEVMAIEKVCSQIFDRFGYSRLNPDNFPGIMEEKAKIPRDQIFSSGGFVDRNLEQFLNGTFVHHMDHGKREKFWAILPHF